MSGIHLVSVGRVPEEIVKIVAEEAGACFSLPTTVDPEPLDPETAYHEGREQYWSTPLLQQLGARSPSPADRVLGIAEVDPFVPIFTFVFGEALLNRPPAIISLCRLRPTFYGLPADPDLTLERACKEAIHELGHTFGLLHCPYYACVMHASRVADELELKGSTFCPTCEAALK